MTFVAAVDVGGTSIKAALVDENLNILQTTNVPTPSNDRNGERTALAIHAIVDEFSKFGTVSAIGFDVPGAVDDEKGFAYWTGNLQWRNVPIKDLVAVKTGLPVAFSHDVRAGAIAEMRNGAAKGYKNAIFLPIGTGIAAGLIIDGKIRASNGSAGEVGHLNVSGPYSCVCGRVGCLEAVSSALAIGKAYTQLSGEENVSAKEVVERTLQHDEVAIKVWDDATSALARACEALITILAPEAIIFGGGLSEAGSLLLDPIQKELKGSLTFQTMPALKIAHFGTMASTIGCALIALDAIGNQVPQIE